MTALHGTSDPIVPFEGGITNIGSATEGLFVTHDRAVQKWIEINHCSNSPTVTNTPDNANDGTTITESEYKNGTNGTQVTGYVINNGGHTWPGGWQYLPEILIGKTTGNLNASEVICDFFKAHPKP